MHKEKAQDEFCIEFITRNWEIVKENVVEHMQYFLRTGVMYTAVNTTAITLIPTSSTHIKYCRPVVRCCTMYKIISKVLTMRLKTIISN